MIKKVLTYCAEQLNSYLSRYHHRPEGLAEVGHIGQSTSETPVTADVPSAGNEYQGLQPDKMIPVLLSAKPLSH